MLRIMPCVMWCKRCLAFMTGDFGSGPQMFKLASITLQFLPSADIFHLQRRAFPFPVCAHAVHVREEKCLLKN